MPESKKPPRQTGSSRKSAPRVSRVPKPLDDATRLAACEKALGEANHAIGSLRLRMDAMYGEIEALRKDVAARRGAGRIVPPPLPPDAGTEIIVVDERDVTLESIRPKGR